MITHGLALRASEIRGMFLGGMTTKDISRLLMMKESEVEKLLTIGRCINRKLPFPYRGHVVSVASRKYGSEAA